MDTKFSEEIAKIARTDLFDRAYILVADAWKLKAKGIPQGSFLLAYYENEDHVREALLLRVLNPAKLPTDSDVVSSMVEYYKDALKSSGQSHALDTFTKYEFSFSGVECRILGTFYRDTQDRTQFGADVENFYSAHHYRIFKPSADVLKLIVNFRAGDEVVGRPADVPIGYVRYSSSSRFQSDDSAVPVFVTPADFLGRRTALFGMTRTGKSNTVKKIIQATVTMSERAKLKLPTTASGDAAAAANLDPFTSDGIPKYPVGQIIFDINGEYANANMQDEGTAIFELYKERVERYSVLEKDGFHVMKVNFYRDLGAGLDLIRSHLAMDGADYVKSFLNIDLTPPEDPSDKSAKTRYERKCAAYMCVLRKAGFKPPKEQRVKFSGNQDLNKLVKADGSIDPSKGLDFDDAIAWWSTIYDSFDGDFFKNYKKDKGRDWYDEDLKAILVFLTRKGKPGGSVNNSGYIKLRSIARLHTDSAGKPFEQAIIDEVRGGKITIVDLSQGDPDIQRLYSERICKHIFTDAMSRFIKNVPNNFVQFYFEEAHNLFPKKDDKDLSQIYNRIAKEGAKLNLGLLYATQEVSSISANILKNTQNWFIAHLNNEDETKELRKYYDFVDFTESLVRFSAANDRGFARMKAYSNSFIVPVQVDRFTAR
jgi:DNA helicase HerA-like ATPase